MIISIILHKLFSLKQSYTPSKCHSGRYLKLYGSHLHLKCGKGRMESLLCYSPHCPAWKPVLVVCFAIKVHAFKLGAPFFSLFICLPLQAFPPLCSRPTPLNHNLPSPKVLLTVHTTFSLPAERHENLDLAGPLVSCPGRD